MKLILGYVQFSLWRIKLQVLNKNCNIIYYIKCKNNFAVYKVNIYYT